MAMLQKSFCLEVLTPYGAACRGEVVSVVFPASDGKVGVLPGRGPLVAVIGAGELAVETAEGGQESYYISGGFAHVRDNAMTVLAEECVATDQLDAEQAWDQLEQARRLPAETDQQYALRNQAIDEARTKFSLAQKHRRKTMRK